MIVTSRSRIVAYNNCQRLGYLSYDHGGTGLEPVTPSSALAIGIEVHRLLARWLTGHQESTTCANEQECLIAGLAHAWWRERWPKLRAEYEVVMVEQELRWPLAEDIIDLVRCDAILRRRADGGLFYLEWKTTSSGGDEWARQWEHNTQLLANTLALEEVLGSRIEGVLIEGLVKGRRQVDRETGQSYQASPLCYGYEHAFSGEERSRWAKGWRRFPVWERYPDPAGWVRKLPVEDLQAICCPVPPIRPNPLHLQRWRKQTIAAERERAAKLAFVRDGGDPDLAFPMNDDHCHRYWGHVCPFEPLCFREEIAQDPVGSGLYQPRTPHHEVNNDADS